MVRQISAAMLLVCAACGSSATPRGDGGVEDARASDAARGDGGQAEDGGADGGPIDGSARDGSARDGSAGDSGGADASTDGGSTAPPILVPGSGVCDPPEQPTSPPGPRVIAHWDTVPYRHVRTTLPIGVLAFHDRGIAAVRFSLLCGPYASVTRTTLNPETGVEEYVATIDASGLPATAAFVDAIAEPAGGGLPRVLGRFHFVADAGGTLEGPTRHVATTGNDASGAGTEASPFRSIERAIESIEGAEDGATISLAPGSYTFTRTVDAATSAHWLTIRGAGAASADVELVASGEVGVRARLLRYDHLRVSTTGPTPFLGRDGVEDHLWLSDLELRGPGATMVGGGTWHASFDTVHATDVSVEYFRDGLQGRCNVADSGGHCTEFTEVFQRHVDVRHIGSDAFSNSAMVVESTARFITGDSVHGYHPDVYQFYGRSSDVILYRVVADNSIAAAQGLFAGMGIEVSNVAFIECTVDNQSPVRGSVGNVFMFLGPTRNMYVRGSRFVGPNFLGGDFSADNVVIEGTTFLVPRRVGDTYELESAPPPAMPGVIYR